MPEEVTYAMVKAASKAIRDGLHPRLLREFDMDTDMLAIAAIDAALDAAPSGHGERG